MRVNKIENTCVGFWQIRYRIVVSTSLSCFDAHAGLFRLLVKGTFDAYVTFFFELATGITVVIK